MEIDWFPETVVRPLEDEVKRKGSKYGVVTVIKDPPPVCVETTRYVPDIPPLDTLVKGNEPFMFGRSLVIPFSSHPRYHWWNGGISLAAIVAEVSGLACPVDYTKISEFTARSS